MSTTGEASAVKSQAKLRGLRGFFNRVDARISGSRFGYLFRLSGSGHACEIQDTSFFREVRAGITTFATMAYIIAVNAAILSQTGGPCPCDEIDKRRCDAVASFATCKEEVRRDLITATSAIAASASMAFGALTNLPVALAYVYDLYKDIGLRCSPGMGLNAYFAFQVVGVNGSGNISYQTALTAVFFEGFIFIVLALTGLRQWLVRLIPATLKTATGVGIGLFLTEIGLSYAVGIGAITGGGNSTPLALGGCPPNLINQASGMCEMGVMTSPRMWLGIVCGGILTALLMAFHFKYSLAIGIALVTVISWPRQTSVTYFPPTEQGDSRFEFFKQVVAWHPIGSTLNVLDWSFRNKGSHFALPLFTFLYVDIIDATATLYSMVRFCGLAKKDDGDFPQSTLAYCTDALFISMGALLGSSPVTAFIESGAGISEGGRTGLTAIVSGLCFLVSLFFAPIFASIPPWATGCTLIMVGCMMIRQVTHINWLYIGDVLPSFVVMAFIPFSYSVAYGLIAGIFVYAALNGLIGLVVLVSRGRIEPPEYGLKEYWTWKGPGRSPWIMRAISFTHRRKTGASPSAHSFQDGSEDEEPLPTTAAAHTVASDYAPGGKK